MYFFTSRASGMVMKWVYSRAEEVQTINLIVTSSAVDKKLEIDKKLENKLEIYKNLENRLEIYSYFKLENRLENFEFFVSELHINTKG